MPLFCFAASNKNAATKPTFITADFVEYNASEDFIYAKGNIKVTIDDYVLNATSLLYDIENDLLWAAGEVKIKDNKNKIMLGRTVFLKDKLKGGVIADFALRFSDNSLLASRLANRISSNQASLYKATFTPCQVSCSSKPIWQISGKHTYLDLDNQKIIYKNLFFEIYGVPILFTPYFSHPTPKAKAQSGILIPNIKKNQLGVPIYYRAKPNLDFTLTPRIDAKYTLLELEARHKINNGSFIATGSYGKVPYKAKKIMSSYFSSQGEFYGNHSKFGFNLNRTSDKAFLKNYQDIHHSYLTSILYFNKIKNCNYWLIEGLNFQGLRTQDSSATDPLVFPKIRTKNIIFLNDQEQTYLTLENNILTYTEQHGGKLTRTATELALTNNMQTTTGHWFSFIARDRGDLYFINNSPEDSSHNNRVISRNIPELSLNWRYPLANQITPNTIMSIEPIMSATIGQKFKQKYNRLGHIDTPKYEITEINLLNSNHYNGIDYHEFGNRLNYGINSTMYSSNYRFNLLLGQSIYKDNINIKESGENVGKVSINFADQFELAYRFRKDKQLRPIKDEISSNIQLYKLYLDINLISLNKLSHYYILAEKQHSFKDKISQVSYNINYQLTSAWLIGNEALIDCSSKKVRMLYRNIKLTYLKDCVSITVKFYDDYTQDEGRGIKKSHSKSFE